jgi:hypothetical protein
MRPPRESRGGPGAGASHGARAAASQPAARGYLILCLVALGFVLLVQLERGAGLGGLLVVLVGLLGVLGRLAAGPILFLLVLGGQQFLRHAALTGHGLHWYNPGWSVEVSDVVLCGAVLAYVLAHYRLLGLVRQVVPLDPRRREGPPRWHFWRLQWLPRVVQERRSARAVSRVEVGLLVMSLPLAALLAQVFWAGLARPREVLGLSTRLWRVLLVAWVLGIGVFLTAAVLRQLRRRAMTPDEAALQLQDVVWLETRREQRRLNRWLAWKRLRRPPAKEPS